MHDGKRLMMDKGLNAFMKAFNEEEHFCKENRLYDELEMVYKTGLISEYRFGCRIDSLGRFFN